MKAFYPIIKNEDDKASKNDTVLRFSKGSLLQAKALQPPVSQAKKHPLNVRYPQYKEVPETDNILQEDFELPTSCIRMRLTMPFQDGFFPGTIIDKFTIVKDGERIQKWKCQSDDGEDWAYGFDKLMQGMTYHKIYP